MPLLARHNHWTAASAGLLIGGQGVGVIAATLVVAHRGSSARPGLAAAAGLATTAVGQLLVAALPAASAAVPCAVLIGIGSGTFVGNLAPVLLGTAPRTHMARIQSLLGVVQSGALLLSNNVLGAIAHLASAPVALLCCSTALGACSVAALCTPTLRRLHRHSPEDVRVI